MKRIFLSFIFCFISITAWCQKEKIYPALILQSNFSLPLIRFNFPLPHAKAGTLEYFNSVGGGFSVNLGSVRIKYANLTSDTTIASTQDDVYFSNIVGLGGGFLFSKNQTRSSFAPVIYISILDFQAAGGYELGDVYSPNSNFFATISLNIPISKLTSTGSFIIKKFKKTDPKVMRIF